MRKRSAVSRPSSSSPLFCPSLSEWRSGTGASRFEVLTQSRTLYVLLKRRVLSLDSMIRDWKLIRILGFKMSWVWGMQVGMQVQEKAPWQGMRAKMIQVTRSGEGKWMPLTDTEDSNHSVQVALARWYGFKSLHELLYPFVVFSLSVRPRELLYLMQTLRKIPTKRGSWWLTELKLKKQQQQIKTRA